ncbi:MAG: hypothetical protein ACUZ8O_00260 [Candidatus Anammoxibacter sp.]
MHLDAPIKAIGYDKSRIRKFLTGQHCRFSQDENNELPTGNEIAKRINARDEGKQFTCISGVSPDI